MTSDRPVLAPPERGIARFTVSAVFAGAALALQPVEGTWARAASVVLILCVVALALQHWRVDRNRRRALAAFTAFTTQVAEEPVNAEEFPKFGDLEPAAHGLLNSVRELHLDYQSRLRAQQDLADIDRQLLSDPSVTAMADRLLRHILNHHRVNWVAAIIATRGGTQCTAIDHSGRTLHASLPALPRLGTESRTVTLDQLGVNVMREIAHETDRAHVLTIHGDPPVGWLLVHAPNEGIHPELPLLTQRIALVASALATRDDLQQRANHDALTGLPNRQLFRDRLENAVLRSKRGAARGALMFIDLDHFKDINDSEGHAAGDHVLKTVAQRLTGALRRTDAVARLGGDEFTVILEQIGDASYVSTIAEQLLAAITLPVTLPNQAQVRVSASIGITIFPDDTAESETLLINADLAMYKVKDTGRDGYRFFSEDMNDRARERKDLEQRLRHAIAQQTFTLVYQPKVNMHTDVVSGVEALLRWSDPELGDIAPARFLPVLEDTGMIVEVGKWVIRRAAEDYRAWNALGIAPAHVAVNISPRQFQHGHFLDDLLGTLTQAGLDPRCLELDITEAVLAKTHETTWPHLSRLHWAGVRIALDDFGTGYSSLRNLRHLPIDTIKIDRSFVLAIGSDRDAEAVAMAVVALARALGKETIGEAVETAEQMTFLTDIGCSIGQGNYFCPPVDRDTLTEFLQQRAAAGRRSASNS